MRISDDKPSSQAGVPGRLALIVALFFWVILLPIVHAGIPYLLALLTPHYGWIEDRTGFWNLLGLLPVALATICLLWLMILHFSRIPKRVKLERTPTYLLVRGPYRLTRNPMYIAELGLWLGWAIFYGSLVVFIGFLLMWPMMNYRIIPREERDLEARFGTSYLEYKNQVPRWL